MNARVLLVGEDLFEEGSGVILESRDLLVLLGGRGGGRGGSKVHRSLCLLLLYLCHLLLILFFLFVTLLIVIEREVYTAALRGRELTTITSKMTKMKLVPINYR